MSDLPSITEGRAYHAGDVVILRSKTPLSLDGFMRMRDVLNNVTEETGVKFLILDEAMEVVEPREVVRPLEPTA